MKLRTYFFKGNKICWGLYTLLVMLDGVMNLILSVILQQITDAAVGKDRNQLIHVCVISGVALAGMMSVTMVQYFVEARFLKRAMAQYKNAVFSKLLKKSRSSFTKENTSNYISALTNDAASIEVNYLQGTVKLISYVFSFVATLVMMFVYSPLLTVIAIALTLIPVVLSIVTGGTLAALEKDVSDGNSEFVGTIKDMLTGFSVIKSFRAEQEIEGIYQKDNKKLEQRKYKRNVRKGQINVLSMGGMVLSQLGVFLAGAYLAISGGNVTAGVLIAFVNMMGVLVAPLGAIPQLMAGRKAAISLMEKMEQALGENVKTTENGVPLKEFSREIALNEVSFGYTEEDVLKGISLTLRAGKSYAIVGGSGSGKSTLLDLIMGNFNDYEGNVSFDGVNLKEVEVNSLYDLISVIQQNVFIFDSTIVKNITMFKEFPKEAIERAIELSGLKNLLEEKGEDYLCGENGCNLSGGEKQRISIARCLLRNASILVADEATAALDKKTAYEVIDAILDMEEMTRIVVTHQLEENILKRYDKIIVMKNGRIEEMGSFEKLLANKKYFYSLYNVAA